MGCYTTQTRVYEKCQVYSRYRTLQLVEEICKIISGSDTDALYHFIVYPFTEHLLL